MTQPLNLKNHHTLATYAKLSADGALDEEDADALVAATKGSATRAQDLALVLAAEHGRALTLDAAQKIRHALGQDPKPIPLAAPFSAPTPTLTMAQAKPKLTTGLKKQSTLAPAPARHELRPISREELERSRRLADHQRARERLQESLNARANLDPFAAQVNGYQRDVRGDWYKAGPGPLETASMVAFGGTVPGQLYGAYKAGEAIHGAAQDPSAAHIAKATLKTALLVGSMAHAAHLSHAPVIEVGVPLAEGVVLVESHRPGGTLTKKKSK